MPRVIALTCGVATWICFTGGALAQTVAPQAADAAARARVGAASTVSVRECLPLEQLSPELRDKSEALLLRMLDSEVLYTLVGGLKPVSCKNLFKLPFIERWERWAEQPIPEFLAAADELRRSLSVWTCGEGLGVYVFSHPKRTSLCDTYFVHLPALSEMIRAHESYFLPLGITPLSHPVEVLWAVLDKDDDRGPGYLFGYPDYAVAWYEDVVVPQVREKKEWPDMDVVQIPTFAKMTARRTQSEQFMFNWAAPKGHIENDADRAIKAKALSVFSSYQQRRAKYITPEEPKVSAFTLLRDWYCGGSGQCAVQNAGSEVKAPINK